MGKACRLRNVGPAQRCVAEARSTTRPTLHINDICLRNTIELPRDIAPLTSRLSATSNVIFNGTKEHSKKNRRLMERPKISIKIINAVGRVFVQFEAVGADPKVKSFGEGLGDERLRCSHETGYSRYSSFINASAR